MMREIDAAAIDHRKYGIEPEPCIVVLDNTDINLRPPRPAPTEIGRE